MPDYRRWYLPGGTYFFTVVTEGRSPLFANETARSLLRSAINETRERFPFSLVAIVLLPDHLHTIWALPLGDLDFSTRWSFLKRRFTQSWLVCGGAQQSISASKSKNRRRGVWQRRFWEHMIRDERDLENHCNYIHFNPVKHGLVPCAHAWPHSSFARFVTQGFYPSDWYCRCSGKTPKVPSFDEIEHTARE